MYGLINCALSQFVDCVAQLLTVRNLFSILIKVVQTWAMKQDDKFYTFLLT